MKKFNPSRSTILFAVGVIGLIFYAVSPILFPGVHGLSQPELLPVYILMMGLGQIVRGPDKEE